MLPAQLRESARELGFVLQADGDEAELGLVGDVVRQRLEHDRVAELARGFSRFVDGRDPMLARDRQPVFGQEPLGIVFVDRAALRPGDEHIGEPGARHRSSIAQRLRRRHVAADAVDGAEPLPGAADLHETCFTQSSRPAAPFITPGRELIR